MKRAMLLAIGIGFAAGIVPCNTVVGAGEENKGAELLEKSAEALKKVKLARYKAQYRGFGWVKQYVPNVEGTAALGEPSKHDILRFKCEVKLTPQGSEEAIELAAGSDGDIYYLTDPTKKIVYADMDEAVLGTHARNLQRVLMQEFVAKDPFADQLEGKTIELKETTDVGGEACHSVKVTTSETRAEVWYISTRDYLPRRIDRLYKNPQGEEGTTQLVITDLVAEPTMNLAPFTLKVPQGFTKTDDFAP